MLMVMKEVLAESCDSRSSMESNNSCKQVQQSGHKLEVSNEILQRLRENHVAETFYPSFEDELWTHFKRGTVRYAIDVNVERAEDVLMHKKLQFYALQANEPQPQSQMKKCFNLHMEFLQR
ncbi:serine/threonine-protein kinase STY17-like [Carex rostrata]